MNINQSTIRPCKHNSLYADTCPKCKAEQKPRDVLGYFMAMCKSNSGRK